ncbi:MAG: hypothetical protein WBX25_15130 [Rhodomicrobium sp.]
MPLTIQELKVAASFLRQAKALCEGVRDFFRGQDPDCAARLGEITNRIDGERGFIERLIEKNGGAS